MEYQEPAVASSFSLNDIGFSIYNYIRNANPSTVVEIGALNGYSSIVLLQALSQSPAPTKLITIDMFENYPYTSCSLSQYQQNISSCWEACKTSVSHIVKQYDVLANPELLAKDCKVADLVFLDISNDATKIRYVKSLVSCPVLFEGGSSERDSVDWMIQYNCEPICSLNTVEKQFYSLVNSNYPSLSVTS